jgi:fructokinase
MTDGIAASARRTVVGLGELLWDLLPEGKQLGGAPANFAYITSLLGDNGIVASRIGNDDLGAEAVRKLDELRLPTTYVQRDAHHPTGVVKVEVDAAGQPRFQIAQPVAWDFMEWTSGWQQLAQQADAVCFGSLAQRTPTSHATIREFVQATRKDAVKVFDVNLRQAFFSADILYDSMKLADIVKLNHDELPRIMGLFDLSHVDAMASARRLAALHNLKLVCVTRGDHGSLLVTREAWSDHPGYKIKVADTVGAGDAFTAGMVYQYLRGEPLRQMGNLANRVGAWVASQVGATPRPATGDVRAELARIS